MRTIYSITLFSVLLLASCNSKQKKEASSNSYIPTEVEYTYESKSIPEFFLQLITNHTSDFMHKESDDYFRFCLFYKLAPKDSSNRNHYFTLKILHELFTCGASTNGSRGDILNIPYFWHHVVPNPRHKIHFTKNHKLLKEVYPPKEFSSCASYADIDRTPALFLCDLFEENPKYFTPECDTFSTFGWCSEREMAFVCLLDLLHFKGKTVARGGHAWSEFIVPFNTIDQKTIHLNIKIDNTFNTVEHQIIKEDEFSEWEKYLGNTLECKWYNEMAHSKVEQQKISRFKTSQKAMNRIEQEIVGHLQPDK